MKSFWLALAMMSVAPLGNAAEFVSHHTITLAGETVHYTAIAGDVSLEDDADKVTGQVFAFTYLRDDVKRPETRPVVFLFNGGPGSASIWTHVEGFGPRAVVAPGPADGRSGPTAVGDNPGSLLDVADLVFIDPIGTGYSRPADGVKPESFFGVKEDAVATTEFIRAWLTKTNRWASPKYLLGESYGTTRAALTAKYLMGGVDTGHLPLIGLRGIVLLGTYLGSDMLTVDTTAVAALPTLAATAWFHGRVEKQGRTLEGFVTAAEQFANNEYVVALYAGNTLSPQRRSEVAARVHDFTGLSVDFILRHDLRVNPHEFVTELMADSGEIVSTYDGRYAAPNPVPPLDPVSDDPMLTHVGPGTLTAWMTYLHNELGVNLTRRYEVTSFVANGEWKGLSENYNLAIELGRTMRQNPAVRVFMGQGYYDLTTLTGTARYALAHGGVPMDRVDFKQYQSGHVVYVTRAESLQLSRDLRAFITATGR